MIDQLLLDLDRNRVGGLIFVDYKKAFDLVDHKILLAKLEAYRIETRDLDLIRTFQLTACSLLIWMTKSSVLATTHAVPQGTVLGPLLFLIFINDLPSQIQHSTVDIYADDAILSTSVDIATGLTSIEIRLRNDPVGTGGLEPPQ